MGKTFIYFRLLRESLFFALNSVIVNKLRTLLTLLGITIGIFAIISVFTVFDWMEKSITESIASLGDDVVYVDKWPWMGGPDIKWWDIIKWPVPNLDEFEEIQTRSKKAEAVAFSIYANRPVKYRNNSADNVLIWSTTHDFYRIRNFEFEKGRYYSYFESKSGKNVVILGNEIANKLFEEEDPIGKEVTIAGRKLIVIGVTLKEGKGGISDDGLDNMVLIPINYVRNLANLRSDGLNPTIMVKAKAGVSLTELIQEIRMIMRSVRRIPPSSTDNFSFNRASAITQGFEAVFRIINIVGWIIGGFSILVGGFGIANIMFVSVKERTRLIGIQKAVGAKNHFILQQFLYEAVILSLIGGAIGLFIIFIGTLIVNATLDWNISLTAGNIILGLSISGIVGIISGYAPAYSASRLDPVDAIGTTF